MLYLPFELIQLITQYLTNNHDQYQCLLVSKAWYEPSHRSLYKSIQINTRPQFKLLFKKKGPLFLVREMHFNKSTGITRQELDTLAHLCPYLEILDFDQDIWKYLGGNAPHHILQKFVHLRQLPNLTSIASLTHTTNLTCLNLCGYIVSDLFQQQGQIVHKILQYTLKLKQLVLNSSQQSKSHVIYITLDEMELIHQTLPLLQDLQMNGSFKFIHHQHMIMTSTKAAVCMRRLSLLKATLAPQCIYYFINKYPQLQDLDLDLVPMYQEIQQDLFSILIKHCPRLNKIELDSTSAKFYMTLAFFDTLESSCLLKEIKIKQSPYHIITRQDNSTFFDLLVKRGQHLISGLGTEVIGTDLCIRNILTPLSKLTQLTELQLHCGHPFFECPMDLVLQQCLYLVHVSIRSAFMTVLEDIVEQQHPLKSLYLSNISFSSSEVFDYLGKACHSLSTLLLYECCNQEQNQLLIHMPYNTFDSIVLNGIRFFTDVVRIVSIQQQEKEKTWYYGNTYCVQRLNHRKSSIAQRYYSGIGVVHSKEPWQKNLCFGQIAITCKSIQYWQLVCSSTTFEF